MAEKLSFQGLDTEAFTGKVKTAWEKYRKELAAAQTKIAPIMQPVNTLRETVEAEVTAALVRDGVVQPGQAVKFGFKFGGMSFAIAAQSKPGRRKIVLGSSK